MGGVIFSTKWPSGGGSIEFEDLASSSYENLYIEGSEGNPLDVAVGIRDWIADPTRPWSSTVSNVQLVVGDDGVRHRFVFSWLGSLRFAYIDPELVQVIGDLTLDPTGPIPGSCSGAAHTRYWEHRDEEDGTRVRKGSWRVGHHEHALRRPSCELELSLAQAHALNEALAELAQPRTAYIWDEAEQTWRWCAIGRVKVESIGGGFAHHRAQLDILGLS